MASLEGLKTTGWYLSEEGFITISKENKIQNDDSVIKIALDIDLREIGSPIIPKDFENGIEGPVVVQIQKLRNISAPKMNESSGAAPRLLKLILTDGHTTCQAIEYEPIPSLSIAKICPGTKIRLQNVQAVGSYLLLTNKCVSVLGGNVPALVERWQLAKSLQKHSRENVEGGPPPWVPFGQKVGMQSQTDHNFKSLSASKDKDLTNNEFNAQRQGAIAEACQGAVRKVFGGGVKSLPNQYLKNTRNENDLKKQSVISNKNVNEESRNNSSRPSKDKRKGREKDENEVQKPSGHISLFDFLENKLPATESEKTVTEQANKNKYYQMMKPTYAQKYDASLRYKGNENRNKKEQMQSYNNKDKRMYDSQVQKPKEKNQFNHNNTTNSNSNRNYQNQSDRNMRYNPVPEKAPRFQKLQNNSNRDGNVPDKIHQTIYGDNRTFDFNKSSFDNKNQIDLLVNKATDLTIQPSYKIDNKNDQKRFFDQNNTFVPKDQNRFSMNLPKEQNIKTNHYLQKEKFENKHSNSNNLYSMVEQPLSQNPLLSSIQNVSNNPYPPDHFTAERFQSGGACAEWEWRVGDQCMAKYWEDNRYYDANITGVTDRTCVVCFKDYGNFEEVLKADCLPISDKPFSNYPVNNRTNLNNNNANKFTGSLIFRRGGNGPYQKNPIRSNVTNGHNYRNQ